MPRCGRRVLQIVRGGVMRLVDHHLAGTGDAEHGCQPESAVNDLVGELRALGLGSFASRSAIFPVWPRPRHKARYC